MDNGGNRKVNRDENGRCGSGSASPLGGSEVALAERLLAGAGAELARLHVVRGTHRRTTRQMRRAITTLALAAGLLGATAVPLPLAAAAALKSATPSFKSPFLIPNVGNLGSAKPNLADIDDDGDLDAFVGDSSGDTVFFENTGTPIAPVFAIGIPNPFGLTPVPTPGLYSYRTAAPNLVDIDGDGDLDAFVGNTYGNTYFFENTGTATTPAFAAATANPFGLADVGNSAKPDLADIDDDGDLDALVGNSSGDTVFFENTGTATAPAFAPGTPNSFGLTAVGLDAAPDLADIDGDGDLDALVGNSSGDTVFFENTGTVTTPAFAPSTTNSFGLSDVDSGAAPNLADIDDDGDLDAFVGNLSGFTVFFENTGTPTAAAFAPTDPNPFGLVADGVLPAPDLADIDDDGDLDAFIGDSSGDTVFFENTGTPSTPAFASAVANPFGLRNVGEQASPDLADIDGDGDLDAFIGNGIGSTYFFENMGSPNAPDFRRAGKNRFGLADVGKEASPDLADIDGDGDLDAFVGERFGNAVFFFENTGTRCAPAFAAAIANPFGLVDVGDRSKPNLVDIDGDGDLDAFVGNREDNTVFFENTGTAIVPTFAAGANNPFGLIGLPNPAPNLADIDDDGDLDAFIGDSLGEVAFFENEAPVPTPTPTPVPTPTPAPFDVVLERATNQIDAVITDPTTPTRAARRLERANAKIASSQRKWDASKGKKALNDLRRSIGDLENSIRAGASAAQVAPTIDELLALILSEAQLMIDDAIQGTGNASRIHTAQDKISRGDAQCEASSAAKWYGQAFTRARGA
jgi:hypothetical protein